MAGFLFRASGEILLFRYFANAGLSGLPVGLPHIGGEASADGEGDARLQIPGGDSAEEAERLHAS